MVRRLSGVVACVAVLMAPCAVPQAWAQEQLEATPVDFTPRLVNSIGALVQPGVIVTDGQVPAPMLTAPRPKPSSILNSLYVSTAVLQGLDMHSTLMAFKAGGIEANPVMAGVTKNQAGFLAAKAAVATSTILATRQLAKRSKVAAIVTLVAVNSAYAMIVRHNYNVARRR